MFTLAVIHDTIKVLSSQLNEDVIASLTYNINSKYSNKILPNVGLCIANFDFIEIGEGIIRHGDGNTYFKTIFRLVIFRPFVGENLIGKVKSSDENGIRISMGFFDDIHVGIEGLPQPSAYDRQEASWFWVWTNDPSQEPEEGGAGGGEGTEPVDIDAIFEDPYKSRKEDRFYFYKDEHVRFVVEGDEFNETEPPGPKKWTDPSSNNPSKIQNSTQQAPASTENSIAMDTSKRIAPYKIKASMSGQGTGMLSWWNESQAVETS